jgi:hypothetical protein
MQRSEVMARCIVVVAAGLMWSGATEVYGQEADEPALPAGLAPAEQNDTDETEPALPRGLGSTQGDSEPGLPAGLPQAGEDSDESALAGPSGGQSGQVDATELEEDSLPFDLQGFWEVRGGIRTRDDPYQKDASIGETRLQVEMEKAWQAVTANLTVDLLYDPVVDRHRPDLDTGEGFVDLREANMLFTPLPFMDVKAGRQILTWGTGDFIFINDLFPKDWNSFFIGRDDEYLKAPSDALKVSIFSDLANLDMVYVPKFDADRFIDGRRVSYWSSTLGRPAGRDAVIQTDQPNDLFSDDEIHLRLYRRFGPLEAAAYGYHGFWKSPGGQNPVTGDATYPSLNVYGASVRGPVLDGIGNVEIGYYESTDDDNGMDPFINNSEMRVLVGYDRELVSNFNIGLQYYIEWMLDYDEYRQMLPAGVAARDEVRHVITTRLTLLTMNQNLKWSLFAFVSPSDVDAYLRPKVHWKVDDHWSLELGANVFCGRHQHTFFGQFEETTNVYAAARYSF